MSTRCAFALVLAILWLWPASLHAQSEALMEAYRQGKALKEAGRYEQAIPFYREALELGEREFGPDHPTTALLLNNLASLYESQGRYAEAEPLYKRALAIWEKALGPDHPDFAMSLNNLAELYRVQANYAEAEPLYERALAILEMALGPEHPNVADSLNNLAALYTAQDRSSERNPRRDRVCDDARKRSIKLHTSCQAQINRLARPIDGQCG